MTGMWRTLFAVVCLLAGAAAAQTTPTADEIMARVAANQDRAEQLRSKYVYQQHVHTVSKLTNGKLMREETADFDVTPTPDGSKKELKSRTGRYWKKGKYLPVSSDDHGSDDDGNLDAKLTSDFVRDLLDDKSKSGLARDLFPLTAKRQEGYAFKLIGETEQDGRKVYRIAFAPKDKEEIAWAGEALIDEQDFQPVLVYTKLSKKLPLLVRGALGTDVPGVGFNVHYRRQEDGVWFPVSFGTEFKVKILFLMKRNISLSMENRDFERTHVDTQIKNAGQD
jgi:hypothetical protein